MAMASPTSSRRVGGAARTGVVGTIVAAVAFFDGVFIGAPVALLAASFGSLLVYALATTGVALLVIACCHWVERRWEDWFSGNGTRREEAREDAGKPPDEASRGVDRTRLRPLVRLRGRGRQPDSRRHAGPVRRRQADRRAAAPTRGGRLRRPVRGDVDAPRSRARCRLADRSRTVPMTRRCRGMHGNTSHSEVVRWA